MIGDNTPDYLFQAVTENNETSISLLIKKQASKKRDTLKITLLHFFTGK